MTQTSRELQERLEAARLNIETKSRRRMHVLRDLPCYKQNYQLDLTEAATIWAFASLALFDAREDCEAYFDAFVDIMYASTKDAESLLSESQRSQLMRNAGEVIKNKTPQVNKGLAWGAKVFSTLDEQHPFRIAGQELNRLLNNLSRAIELVPQETIGELIARSVDFCLNNEFRQMGGNVSDEEVFAALDRLFRIASNINRVGMAHQDSTSAHR